MKFKQALVAVGAILALSSASASLVGVAPGQSFGTNFTEQSFYGSSYGAINDYSFSITGLPTDSWSLLLEYSAAFLPVDVAEITLVGSTGYSAAFDPTFTDYKAAFTGLTAGDYTLKFATAATPGSTGVLFGKATLVAAPVPETSTYAMTLVGLGVAGTLLRRRKMA